MANTIQIKRRTSAGLPSGLAAGELAVNLSDNKLYVGNAAEDGVIHLNPSASTSYLPLSGGTLTGNLTVSGTTSTFGTNGSIILKDPYAANDAALEIKRDAGANSSILLHGEGDSYIANGITGGLAVGSTSPSGFKFQVAGTAKITSDLTVGGNLTVAGTISADNADTLDNLDSTQFLRSDADDTTTGTLTVGSSVNAAGLVVKRESSGNPYIQFNKGATRHAYIQSYNNELYLTNDNGDDIDFRTGNADNLTLGHSGNLFSTKSGTLGTSANRWSTIYGAAGNFSGHVTLAGDATGILYFGSKRALEGQISNNNLDLGEHFANIRMRSSADVFPTNSVNLGTSSNRWSTIYGSAGDFSGNLTVSGSCTFAALSGTTGTFSGKVTSPNLSNKYHIPNTGGSASWIKLGNISTAQSGRNVFLRIVSASGYNAATTQNTVVDVYFRTSNGSSSQSGNGTDGGSFYGSARSQRHVALGTNTNSPSVIRIVQVSQTSYDFYGSFNTFVGTGSFYEVTTSTSDTWTNSGTTVSEPTTGTLINTYPSSIPHGFTASGTAGKVAIWSSDTLLTTDTNLNWDAANDRLGIGEKLRLSANTLYGAIGDSSDTNRYMVLKDGLIGVGLVSPSAKVHIAGSQLGQTLNDYQTHFHIQASLDGNTGHLQLKDVRTAAGNSWTTSGRRLQMKIDSTYMGYIQWNGTGNNYGMSFGTGSTTSHPGNVTEAMRIDSSQRVGIGNIAPSYKFEITSDAGTGLISRIYNTNSDGQGLLIRAGATSSATRVLQLASANDTKVMTVNSNGRVGINQTSPDSLLHIEDDYTLTKHLLHLKGGGSSGNYGMLLETANGTDLFKIDTLTYKVTMPSGYPVGIGTTDPAGLLSLAKGTRTLDIKLETSPATGDMGVQFRAGSGDYLGLAAGGGTGTGIVIDDSNRVGIGTASLSAKLHVVGDAFIDNTGASGGLTVEASSDAKVTLQAAQNTAYHATLTAHYNYTTPMTLRGYGGIVLAQNTGVNKTLLYAGNAEQIRITTTGVGIGLGGSDPSTKLHVGGSAIVGRTNATGAYPNDDYDLLVGNGNSGTTILLYNNASNYHSGLIKYDANCLKLGLNNSNSADSILTTTAVNITNTGVGIGTASPSAKLHINETSTGTPLQITRASNSGNGMIKFETGSTDDWIVGLRNDSTSNFRIYSYGTSSDVFSINRANGNVSIGSTSSAYGRLFVDATSNVNSASALAIRGRDSSASYIALNVMNNADGAIFSILNNGKAELTHVGGADLDILTVDNNRNTVSDQFGIKFQDSFRTRARIHALNENTGNARGSLVFETGYSTDTIERARLNSDGEFGIGCTPSAKLHINGTAGEGWDRNIGLSMDGTMLGKIVVDAEGIKYRTIVSGDDHTFRNSGNADTLRIKDSGKLGIGLNNSNPTETADIVGTLKYGTSTSHTIEYFGSTGTIAGDTLTTINWRNGTSTLDRNYNYRIECYVENDTSTESSAVYLLRDDAPYASGTVAWSLRYVSKSGSSSNHVAVVMSSTSTVIQVKHFHGSASYPIGYKVTATKRGTQNNIGWHGFGGEAHWQRDGDTIKYLDGTVEINPTGQVTPLTIKAASSWYAADGSKPTMQLQYAGTVYGKHFIDSNWGYCIKNATSNGGGELKLETTDGSIHLRPNGSTKLTATTTGIGIGGVTAPDGTLHVHTASAGTVTADTDRDDLVIENSANVGLTFLSPNTTKQAIAFGDPQNSRVGLITYDHADDSLAVRCNNTDNLLKVTSTGVGIGQTPSSGFKLDVSHEARIGDKLTVSSNIPGIATASGGLRLAGADGSVQCRDGSGAQNFSVWYGASSKARLDSNGDSYIMGDFGCGTSSPSGYQLYVNGTSYFNNTQTATSNVHVASDANTNLHINGATHAGETWDGAIHIKNSATIGNETSNEAVIYAEGGELKCMDDDRNRTTLSSHIDGKWVYMSNNTKTGKSVKIHMEDLVKAVEEHLGVSFSEIVEGTE